MSVNLETYKEMLTQPWGKIMYELIFAQLESIKGKRILDFGAGFGLTAQHLSQENTITAIEPNADMLFADAGKSFTKIHGSLDALKQLPNAQFDAIICHNVMEYIPEDERPSYFSEFERLLVPGGQLSLIKHNQVGKVMQAVVFSNDINLALDLLDGKSYESLSFANGTTYDFEDLKEYTSLTLQNYRGLRTFYALQPNSVKSEEGWLDNLLKAELAVADLTPYKDISFLQHLTLVKKV
ncbi:class I SAM-dependent methyltransferase [Streptococcus hillyeri]|uniref:class I SAM-dependent methyltransferase n=1 Tax=Streptococcus hillyeri TaxID=2282420 RepID=UPI0034E2D675